jgi:hypothetical protein
VVAFRLESVVAFDRNRWSPSTGMGGRLRPEYAVAAATDGERALAPPAVAQMKNRNLEQGHRSSLQR